MSVHIYMYILYIYIYIYIVDDMMRIYNYISTTKVYEFMVIGSINIILLPIRTKKSVYKIYYTTNALL